MEHKLPELPYAKDALAPHISEETLTYHHDKHHAAYVAKLNDLIKGTEFEDASLQEIVMRAQGPIFNNGAQAWNHEFYWNSMTPGGAMPAGDLAKMITEKWGSFDKFKEEFTNTGVGLFGSGWVWLMKDTGSLSIVGMSNAGNPLTEGKQPLLTMDVWEHAYYIDYRNLRPDYINHFFEVANWTFAEQNLSRMSMAAGSAGAGM